MTVSAAGWRIPKHIYDLLREPNAQPVCECGKPAVCLARFPILSGESAVVTTGLLVCNECAALMLADDPRVRVEPFDELAEQLAKQSVAYFARIANRGKRDRGH